LFPVWRKLDLAGLLQPLNLQIKSPASTHTNQLKSVELSFKPCNLKNGTIGSRVPVIGFGKNDIELKGNSKVINSCEYDLMTLTRRVRERP
jgi:hypothetical protein